LQRGLEWGRFFALPTVATPHIAGGVALLWQTKPALAGNIDATEGLMSAMPYI
jgi:hypothetical protein